MILWKISIQCAIMAWLMILLLVHNDKKSLISAQSTSKTFLATKFTNLKPIPVDEGVPIENVSALVQSTERFHTIYKPSNRQFNFGADNEENLIPNIEFIRGSDLTSNSVQGSDTPALTASPYGLVGTVATAYAHHYNLRLRPDDVWITIVSQFAAYLLARSEQLRDRIVDFEGKRNLEITVPGSAATFDWSLLPPMFLDLIAENVKNATLREWFLPGFSTTTPNDVVAASAAAMCTLQNFFTFSVSFVCGIPQVTLVGAVDDWQRLRAKVDLLAEFDDGTGIITNEWLPLLQEILDNFVESSMNGSLNNLDFWHQIVHAVTVPYDGDMLTGWIIMFTFFDEQGQRLVGPLRNPLRGDPIDDPIGSRWGAVAPGDVNPNVLSCPISVDDNGRPLNSTLFVGQMVYGTTQDGNASSTNFALEASTRKDAMLITARNDWAIVLSNGFVQAPQQPSRRRTRGVEICVDELEFPIPDPITPSPTPAPTPSGIVPDFCFSKTSLVHVQNKGLVTIDQVEIGDMVLSNNNDKQMFSRVYSFGHLHPTRPAEFLQIHSTSVDDDDSSSSFLEISKNHLLFVNGVMVPASTVRVGDVLTEITTTTKRRNRIVSKIKSIQRKGVYAPFTESGTIVVNHVLASNYITFQRDSAVWTIGMRTLFTMHGVAHGYQTFHRLACSVNWSLCAKETYTKEMGLSNWIALPFQIVLWILNQKTITVLSLLFALATIVVGIMFVARRLVVVKGKKNMKAE